MGVWGLGVWVGGWMVRWEGRRSCTIFMTHVQVLLHTSFATHSVFAEPELVGNTEGECRLSNRVMQLGRQMREHKLYGGLDSSCEQGPMLGADDDLGG